MRCSARFFLISIVNQAASTAPRSGNNVTFLTEDMKKTPRPPSRSRPLSARGSVTSCYRLTGSLALQCFSMIPGPISRRNMTTDGFTSPIQAGVALSDAPHDVLIANVDASQVPPGKMFSNTGLATIPAVWLAGDEPAVLTSEKTVKSSRAKLQACRLCRCSLPSQSLPFQMTARMIQDVKRRLVGCRFVLQCFAALLFREGVVVLSGTA
jgi:hypothetical protein